MSSFLANTYATGTVTCALITITRKSKGQRMTQIFKTQGKYTVVVDGLVIGHNLTRKEAMRKVEDYDRD